MSFTAAPASKFKKGLIPESRMKFDKTVAGFVGGL